MKPIFTTPRRRCAGATAAILTTFISAGHQGAAAEPPAAEVVKPALANAMPDVAEGSMATSGDGISSMNDIGASTHHMSGGAHGAVPAGVFGAHMLRGGSVMLFYSPMFMGMNKNYIGSSTVSQQYIATQIPYVPFGASSMKPPTLRIVPSSMSAQMNMFHAMFGLTDTVNVMVMGNYIRKSMTMTTFAGKNGSTPLGDSSSSTEGWGDTSFMGLVRLYQDEINHVHLNLGASVPSGSITEQATMLNPMGKWMTMRANYGMQLGTGTYDALYGVTYTGKLGPWSWGLVYRGRAALGANSEGYSWGPSNEVTGWGAYQLIDGLNLTARAGASAWGRIYGYDYLISGPMQAANHYYYGGQRVELFGGLEYKGLAFGLAPVRLAVEAGAPVYQNLNGPQMGKAWQVNVALGIRF